MERAKPLTSVTLRCQTDRCGCQTRWLWNASVPVLIVKGIGEGRLSLMFTYEYYCVAFPVRNQVCDFWEVLVAQGLAVGKKCLLQNCLGCLQTDGNSEFNCTVVISLSHLFWKPFLGRRGSQPQSELQSVLPVDSSSATSALVWWQLLSEILQFCLLRLPLASGRLGHMRDLTHVHVGFDGMLRFFCWERSSNFNLHC